jgi:hypothetical protein
MPRAEGDDQILDIVCDIQKMIGKVGKGSGKLSDAPTLKALIIGKRANVHRNIATKLFGKRSARIFSRYSKKFGMLKLALGRL